MLLVQVQAAEECTSVLELDHNHTGALMLRAQTLVTLKDYHSALFDVNRLLELNPSSEVYQNLEARLRTQLVCPHIWLMPFALPYCLYFVFLWKGNILVSIGFFLLQTCRNDRQH